MTPSDLISFEIGLAVVAAYIFYAYNKSAKAQSSAASARDRGLRAALSWARQELGIFQIDERSRDIIEPLGFAAYYGGHIGFPAPDGVAIIATKSYLLLHGIEASNPMKIRIPYNSIIDISVYQESVPQLLNLNIAAILANAAARNAATWFVLISYRDKVDFIQTLKLAAGIDTGGPQQLARKIYNRLSDPADSLSETTASQSTPSRLPSTTVHSIKSGEGRSQGDGSGDFWSEIR